MEQCYQKWIPHHDLDTMYDVEDVSIGENGFVFTMVPDGARRKELEGQTLLFVWRELVSFQISQESYRDELWRSAAGQGSTWSFFKSTSSPYLQRFRQSSCLFPEETAHYCLVGTNLVADILAREPPSVTVIAPDERVGTGRGKEIEVRGCIEVPMHISEEKFWERFITFIEANHWSFGGGMRTIVNGRDCDEGGEPVHREEVGGADVADMM